MRRLPQWALEMLAKPRQDLLIGVLVKADPEESEAEMFRIQLLHAYAKAMHETPDRIQDPLVRLIVRLSDSTKYDMATDDLTWSALFAVLRENSAEHFTMWINQKRDHFWLEQDLQEIAPWAYEDASGEVVDRFPEMNKAMEELAATIAQMAPPSGRRPATQAGGGSPAKQGGCYIATAVYGSYDAPPVLTLRRFRDDRLAQSQLGRALIRLYYSVSPTLARNFNTGSHLNTIGKRALDVLVRRLERDSDAPPQ